MKTGAWKMFTYTFLRRTTRSPGRINTTSTCRRCPRRDAVARRRPRRRGLPPGRTLISRPFTGECATDRPGSQYSAARGDPRLGPGQLHDVGYRSRRRGRGPGQGGHPGRRARHRRVRRGRLARRQDHRGALVARLAGLRSRAPLRPGPYRGHPCPGGGPEDDGEYGAVRQWGLFALMQIRRNGHFLENQSKLKLISISCIYTGVPNEVLKTRF